MCQGPIKPEYNANCRFLAATKQLYEWVCLSVCHNYFTLFPSSYHHDIFRFINIFVRKWSERSKVKFTEVKTNFAPNWVFPGRNSSFNTQMALRWWDDHKVWTGIEDHHIVFSRSSAKFQGHEEHQITYFDPNWAFPDYNSSLNSHMATKWYTKLEVACKSSLSAFALILAFQTITPLWIDRWLGSEAESLKQPSPGALLFFKIIREISKSTGQKLPIFTRAGRFWIVTPVWIDQWLWNDAQSLK